MTNLDDVLARIRRLERTVLGLILLALAALLVAGAAWRALWAERSIGPALDTIRAGSVETGELVLRDRDGNVRGRLQIAGPEEGTVGPRLTLYDPREDPAAQQWRLEVTPYGVHILGSLGDETNVSAGTVSVSGKNGGTVRLGTSGKAEVSLKMQEAEVDIGAKAASSWSPPEQLSDLMPSSWVRVHGGSWWSTLAAYPKHANVSVEEDEGPGKPSPRGDLSVTSEGVSVTIGDTERDQAVLGATALENPRTGSSEETGPASLALFDKQGKVLFRAP
jgi:hypothetical protein